MTPPPGPSPREALASLISLTPRVTRAAWIGGVVLALGLAGTATWALLTHRVYESEASILFERGVQSVGGLEGDTPNQVLLRLQDMLTARQRLEPIIKQLNLYSSTQDQRGMVGALEEMRKAIKIGGNGWFSFRVTFNAESRDVAQSVLERLVKETIDEDTQRRIHQAEEGKRFLDTEKERADENVKSKEAALGGVPGRASSAGPRGRRGAGRHDSRGRSRSGCADPGAGRRGARASGGTVRGGARGAGEAGARQHRAASGRPGAGRGAAARAQRASGRPEGSAGKRGALHQRAPRRQGGAASSRHGRAAR